MHDISGSRTDYQGLRREIQKANENQDTVLTRLENILQLVEQNVAQMSMIAQQAQQAQAPAAPPTLG